MMQLRVSSKKQAKIKLALQGCAGSGKTMSALLLAYGLCNDWGRIAIIDSENGSADLYANLGNYNVLSLQDNFTPETYMEAIGICEDVGMEVIIIDSISQCWDNLLEYHANLQGNSFTNWQKVTPRINAFMQKILQSEKHIICTMRCKQDYVLNEKNGKLVPEKVGLKAVMRDGIDYEFTIVFDINMKHQAIASKDRTNLFMGKPDFTITPTTGQIIFDWCNDGVNVEMIRQQINKAKSIEELTAIYHKYPEWYQQLTSDFMQKKMQLQEEKNKPSINYSPNFTRYVMQLQPVKANMTYPSRISRVLDLSNKQDIIDVEPVLSGREVKRLPFIEANTKEISMVHLKNECIVPVFSKDNEITISHPNFIETVWEAANRVFPDESIELPEIRVSHIIKGRTPEAIHKSVKDLLEEDKTIYYERMMFCFEIPSIYEDINGNRLNLTIGGVRAYNHENLYSKKGMEKFKIFIGFKNMVCCNMCVSTDGFKSELKVMDVHGLLNAAMQLFQEYNAAKHLYYMGAFKDSYMTEHQFAQFLGKCRLYQYLPVEQKKRLPQMLMTDTQIGIVAKSFYHDENFSTIEHGNEISMWNVYNLLTGANKSSYIDNFLDRAYNATQLADGLNKALYGDSEYTWFIQ